MSLKNQYFYKFMFSQHDMFLNKTVDNFNETVTPLLYNLVVVQLLEKNNIVILI